MSKQPFPLKNRLVVEAFEKFNGNQKKLHSVLCSIVRVDCQYQQSVFEDKKCIQYFKKVQEHRYNEYLSQGFTFPKSAKKQLVVKNENIPSTKDDLSEEKSQKIISHYETVIVKLREELSQQRQLLQKYPCKTRSQENTFVSLRRKSNGYKTRTDW